VNLSILLVVSPHHSLSDLSINILGEVNVEKKQEKSIYYRWKWIIGK